MDFWQGKSQEQRVSEVMDIAEGYIKSARDDCDFGGVRGFNYGYAYGLFAGWHQGGLITENQMQEYRNRLDQAIRRRGRGR